MLACLIGEVRILDNSFDYSISHHNDSFGIEIPSENQIRELLEVEPLQIIRFANQFFQSAEHSSDLKTKAAELLSDLLVGESRIHFWEALSGFARQGANPCDPRLFSLAKRVLMDATISPEETGAIRNFLSDLRIFAEKESEGDCSESARFFALNKLARRCSRDDLVDAIKSLDVASYDENFLIRESAAEGLGILGTRSDLDDADIMPFTASYREILNRLSEDESLYVQQSVITVISLVEFGCEPRNAS